MQILYWDFFTPLTPHKTDMVDFDDTGRVRSIQIKPPQTNLKYAWEMAVWGPSFTEFMHDYVSSRKQIIIPENRMNCM